MASEKINIVIKAVDKTKRAFRAVTVSLNFIKKAAFSMQSALIAAGALGFGYLVKKSLNATDALGKMADKIGIGTAELGGLRHAAELTGVATNTLDMGLQRMVRRISEAAAGAGEAKAALIELGLSAKALNKLAPDKQFKAIADAMEKVTEQGERVRLAMRLFDSEGVALVNTLKGGSAAIKEVMAEAEKLGFSFSGALVKGVEKANDSINTLGKYLINVFHRSVAELAPAIKAVTDNIREWLQLKIEDKGGIVKFTQAIAVSVLEASKSVVIATTAMLNSIGRVANHAARAINSVLRILPTSMGGLPELDVLREKLKNLGDEYKTLSKNDWHKAERERIGKQITAINELIFSGEVLEDIKPFVGFKTTAAIDDINKLIEKMNALPDTVGGTSDSSSSDGGKKAAVELSNAQIARLMDDYNQMVIGKQMTQDEYLLTLQNDYESIAEGKKLAHQQRMTDLTHQYLSKQSAMQKAANKGEIDSVKESGIKVVGALKGQYKWAFDLHKTFAIKDALIDTYKAVSTAMASAPPPLNFGLAAVALAQGIANVQMLRSTSYREKGGPITAGQPYIVGERGPELIVPNHASNVVPHDQLGGNNITFNIQANDTRGFDQLLQQRRGQIIGMINQAMNDRGQRAFA